MKFKRVIIFIILYLFIFNRSTWGANPPNIGAKAGILMDVNSCRVLYKKNIYEKRPMASTTKIMTAIIALENGDLDEIITISKKAASTEGSSIWLEPGERLTLEELLYGLMLNSGNDAAVAIAEHIGGSVEGFSKLMNNKAREIGAINTNFTNPHGLPDDRHYTTVFDLALIARYALTNPDFKKIVSTQKKTITWYGKEWDRQLYNKNKLLWQFEGADGIKTGYTRKAGRCLVASATRNHWQLLSVVLASPSIFDESKALLEYGFNNYTPVQIINKEKSVKTVKVKDGTDDTLWAFSKRDIIIPLSETEKDEILTLVETPDYIIAPIKEGQVIGQIKVMLNGEILGIAPLVAQKDIFKKKRFFDFKFDIFRKTINNLIKQNAMY